MVVFEEPDEMPGIKTGSATCQPSALTTVLSLWPQYNALLWKPNKRAINTMILAGLKAFDFVQLLFLCPI